MSIGSEKTMTGGFVWPGFGENARVLEWVFERCAGRADAIDTPIGPTYPPSMALIFTDLNLVEDAISTLLKVDIDGWLAEIPLIEAYYESFGEKVPDALWEQLKDLKQRLLASGEQVA
jgi:phosphoenolpyruvate carboxykinase (GTP)